MASRPELIGLEGMKRLEGRNIKELSLEEALEIKDLLDAGASAYLPVGALNGPTTTRRIYLNMLSELNAHIEEIYRKWAAPDEVEDLHAAVWGPAPNKRGRIKSTDRVKAEAKARWDEQKAASAKAFDLSFTINTYEGEEYFVNDRGDVLRMDGTWVGRFDGSKIVAMPEPANIAGAKMRALRPMTAPPPQHRMAAALAAAPRAPWARAASPPRESRGVFAARLRSVQRANKQARNTAELNALRALNRRESRNAAAAIFSNKSKKNKPKWGIPNLGTGFGGGRTRRNSYKRRR